MSLSQKRNYVQWLEAYNWGWFCTLTFRFSIGRTAAARIFREWIEKIEKAEGAQLSWVRIGEYGEENHRLHYHALIAGLPHCDNTRRQLRAEDLWDSMAGDAEVDMYERDGGALPYMLKSLEDGPDIDFDAELKDEHRIARQILAALEDDPEWAV